MLKFQYAETNRFIPTNCDWIKNKSQICNNDILNISIIKTK